MFSDEALGLRVEDIFRVEGFVFRDGDHVVTRRILNLRVVPVGTLLDLTITTSQNCEAEAHTLLHHSTLGSRVIQTMSSLVQWSIPSLCTEFSLHLAFRV